jgi:hypothetical protein
VSKSVLQNVISREERPSLLRPLADIERRETSYIRCNNYDYIWQDHFGKNFSIGNVTKHLWKQDRNGESAETSPALDADGFQRTESLALLKSLFAQARNFATYEETETFLARTIPATVVMLGNSFVESIRSIEREVDPQEFSDFLIALGLTDPKLVTPPVQEYLTELESRTDSPLSRAASNAIAMLQLSEETATRQATKL